MYIEVSDRYYLILHPRPAYIIVSGGDGKFNLMAASWVMPVSEEPPHIALALDRESYTYELINKYREFTVNVVSHEYADKVWYVGSRSGYDVDKVKSLGIKLNESKKIKVPWIDGALAYLEARVVRMYEVGEVDLVIASVESAYANENYFNRRFGWDLRKVNILMHLWGRGFTWNDNKFIYVKK